MKKLYGNSKEFSSFPVSGRIYDDTIDGYFPLPESIRQMLLRLKFCSAWISIVEAPFIDLPNLPATSLVPVRLHPDTPCGTIQYMALVATLDNDKVRLSGVARWSWLTSRSTRADIFPLSARLAEPAYVRGIGLYRGKYKTSSYGDIAITDSTTGNSSKIAGGIAWGKTSKWPGIQALDALGWNSGLFWGLQHHESRIVYLNDENACLAKAPAEDMTMPTGISAKITAESTFEYLILDPHHHDIMEHIRPLVSDHQISSL